MFMFMFMFSHSLILLIVSYVLRIPQAINPQKYNLISDTYFKNGISVILKLVHPYGINLTFCISPTGLRDLGCGAQ